MINGNLVRELLAFTMQLSRWNATSAGVNYDKKEGVRGRARKGAIARARAGVVASNGVTHGWSKCLCVCERERERQLDCMQE